MRVMFGNHIELCKTIVHSNGCRFLVITTMNNVVYTVHCIHDEIATALYNRALTNGYIDVSNFDYSN